MKKYLAVILLLTLPMLLMAQAKKTNNKDDKEKKEIRTDRSIGYSFGYGIYNLNGMQQLLDERIVALNKFIGEENKILDKFPNYFTHTIDFSYSMAKEEFGLQLVYMSTQSKIDHSSKFLSYQEKAVLTGLRLGSMYRRHIMQLKLTSTAKMLLYGEISPGLLISSLKYKGLGITGKMGAQGSDLGGSSVGLSIVPAIGLKTDITKRIGIRMSAGYDFCFGGKIKNAGDAKVNWSGARLNAGAYYNF